MVEKKAPRAGFPTRQADPARQAALRSWRSGRNAGPDQGLSSLKHWRGPIALGPCRFQMAETTCQPQFEAPHHLEWLIRRLSASSIWGRMRFFAGRPVRSWRRVLRFRRAPPGPVLRAFARGWVGSRYRAGKRMGGGLQLGSPRNPLRAGWLPSLPLVGRGDFPQPQKLRPHS